MDKNENSNMWLAYHANYNFIRAAYVSDQVV